MKDEEKIIGVIQMVINMGDEAFSKEEVEELIEYQLKQGGLTEARAQELKSQVEERDKRHRLEKEERVSGIIEMLTNLSGETFPNEEVISFIDFLKEKGSLSEAKAGELVARIEKANEEKQLQELKKKLPA